MGRSSERIEPERLFEATEAVLDAVIEVAEMFDGIYLHPPQLLKTTFRPLRLREFTAFEVQEATQFLVRLGVLPAETPSAWSDDG
ncbi:MAG: hypothetical protein ACYTA3_01490 [Planctomycetota bacterium]|jgi:hypothetical protein